jgi:hypothetical protein
MTAAADEVSLQGIQRNDVIGHQQIHGRLFDICTGRILAIQQLYLCVSPGGKYAKPSTGSGSAVTGF